MLLTVPAGPDLQGRAANPPLTRSRGGRLAWHRPGGGNPQCGLARVASRFRRCLLRRLIMSGHPNAGLPRTGATNDQHHDWACASAAAARAAAGAGVLLCWGSLLAPWGILWQTCSRPVTHQSCRQGYIRLQRVGPGSHSPPCNPSRDQRYSQHALNGKANAPHRKPENGATGSGSSLAAARAGLPDRWHGAGRGGGRDSPLPAAIRQVRGRRRVRAAAERRRL